MRTQPLLLQSGESKQAAQPEPGEYIVNTLLHLFTLPRENDRGYLAFELTNRYSYLRYDLSCLSADEYNSISLKYIKFLIDVDKHGRSHNLIGYFTGRFFKTIFCKNYLNFILPIFDVDLIDVKTTDRLLSCLYSLKYHMARFDDVDKSMIVSRLLHNLPRWRQLSSSSDCQNSIVDMTKSVLLYYFIHCRSDKYLDECSKVLIPLDVDEPFVYLYLDYQFDWESLDKPRQQFLLRLITLHLEHKDDAYINNGLCCLKHTRGQFYYDQYRPLLPALVKLMDSGIIEIGLNKISSKQLYCDFNIPFSIEFMNLLSLFVPPQPGREKTKWIIEDISVSDMKHSDDDLIPWCNLFASDRNGIRYRGKQSVSETSHSVSSQHHPRLSRHRKID